VTVLETRLLVCLAVEDDKQASIATPPCFLSVMLRRSQPPPRLVRVPPTLFQSIFPNVVNPCEDSVWGVWYLVRDTLFTPTMVPTQNPEPPPQQLDHGFEYHLRAQMFSYVGHT
jgi:hypothetical protein